jgi:hypothetical protein
MLDVSYKVGYFIFRGARLVPRRELHGIWGFHLSGGGTVIRQDPIASNSNANANANATSGLAFTIA